jgi:hypothetical protein
MDGGSGLGNERARVPTRRIWQAAEEENNRRAGFPKAETLAYRPEIYRLAAPPTGVDRDAVDKLWDLVESALRDLVAWLAACLPSAL